MSVTQTSEKEKFVQERNEQLNFTTLDIWGRGNRPLLLSESARLIIFSEIYLISTIFHIQFQLSRSLIPPLRFRSLHDIDLRSWESKLTWNPRNANHSRNLIQNTTTNYEYTPLSRIMNVEKVKDRKNFVTR